MDSIIAALVSFFLIDPLQAELKDRLVAAQAPRAVLAEVSSCAQAAGPELVKRATEDPMWAVSKVVSVWIGESRPEVLLVEVVPGCAGAAAAARSVLSEQNEV